MLAQGYDVASITQMAPGANGESVIELAVGKNRILLTEDKDFGQLVYAAAKASTGVVLIRYPAILRTELPIRIHEFVKLHGVKLKGSFVVLQPGKARISRLPPDFFRTD